MKDLTLTPLGLRAGNWLLPCVIGKNGISKLKKEGDGKTPTGRHQIVGMLYRPDRLSRPRKWALPIRPRDNWPYAVKGRGSAIFIHSWRKNAYPTAGCIALSKKNLLMIAKFIDYGSRLIVPQTLHAHQRWPNRP